MTNITYLTVWLKKSSFTPRSCNKWPAIMSAYWSTTTFDSIYSIVCRHYYLITRKYIQHGAHVTSTVREVVLAPCSCDLCFLLLTFLMNSILLCWYFVTVSTVLFAQMISRIIERIVWTKRQINDTVKLNVSYDHHVTVTTNNRPSRPSTPCSYDQPPDFDFDHYDHLTHNFSNENMDYYGIVASQK